MAGVQDNRFPIASPLGSVFVSADAIAEIVSRTAARCYGVVGLAPKTRVARLLGRETASAVSVTSLDRAVKIDLHVAVLYGLNLAEVGATVRSQVAYEVERLTGLPVTAVEVHIEKVRRSA
jgi:uncharacterized alkaline shock family protein YloU